MNVLISMRRNKFKIYLEFKTGGNASFLFGKKLEKLIRKSQLLDLYCTLWFLVIELYLNDIVVKIVDSCDIIIENKNKKIHDW